MTTLDEMVELVRSLRPKAWEKTLVCSPAREKVLTETLDLPKFYGQFKIITSPYLPEDKVYIINDEVMEKVLDKREGVWFP